MTELEQLTKRASEILGSEEAGQAFVDGFIKEANFLTNSLGAAAGGVVAGGAVLAISNFLNQTEKAKLHVKFQAALSQLKNSNRLIKAAPSARVDAYASTIFNFAPNVATDPNLLGSVLSNVIQGESIDPMTIKMLTELEGRYKENQVFKLPGVKMGN